MIQNVLSHLGGIEGYGLASLCCFFLVFAGVVVWALLQRKAHLERMAQMPLAPDAEPLNPAKDSP